MCAPIRFTDQSSFPPSPRRRSPHLLKSEGRRRQSVDHALHEAEAKLRELVRRRDKADAAAAATGRTEAESADDAAILAQLRGQVSRARERAEILEERLDETKRANRRLEREVAEAVELAVSEKPLFCGLEVRTGLPHNTMALARLNATGTLSTPLETTAVFRWPSDSLQIMHHYLTRNYVHLL